MRPAVLALLLACALRRADALPVPPTLVVSNSSVGHVLIRNCSHVQAFSQQIMHFTTQARAAAPRRAKAA